MRISGIAYAAVLQSRREINEGMPLAGALDMQSPAPGRANRIGMSSAAFDNRVALGLNYTRRQDEVDLGAAVSFTDERVIGKISAGWSW